jgi:nicotinate-nucleotide pyrophosphorylase
MPALWIEILAQAAALTLAEGDSSTDRLVLAGVERFELLKEPGPGAGVRVAAELMARLGSVVKVRAEARRDDGVVVARGELLLAVEPGS